MDDNFDNRDEQLPWCEKYRAIRFNDVYLPDVLEHKFSNMLNTQDIPNLILDGPPGTGKSCVIKALLMEMYNKYYNDAVLELNLSDDRGIKFLQNGIVTFCKTKIAFTEEEKTIYPNYKIILIDEADNIIDRIQDQLKIIITNYKQHVRFVFTCNSASEINEAIHSECLIIPFSVLPDELVLKKLLNICKAEKAKYTEKALQIIANISRGDMRSAINMLHLVYITYTDISKENVETLCNITPEVTIKKIFKAIINNDCKTALETTLELKNDSYSGSDILFAMLTTIKSDICNDIEEDVKIKLTECISNGIYKVSNITDSSLQIAGCIVDMMRAVNK
jgi:replication factor C subunit 2/4